MSPATGTAAVFGGLLVAVLALLLLRITRRARLAPARAPASGLAEDSAASEGPTVQQDEDDPPQQPFGPNGEYGFILRAEPEREADGTWLHTRTLHAAEGLVFPVVTLELIAPTLRHGEFIRGDVVVDSLAAHGGVLKLRASDVSGHLVARFHTTDAAERVRAYWSDADA